MFAIFFLLFAWYQKRREVDDYRSRRGWAPQARSTAVYAVPRLALLMLMLMVPGQLGEELSDLEQGSIFATVFQASILGWVIYWIRKSWRALVWLIDTIVDTIKSIWQMILTILASYQVILITIGLYIILLLFNAFFPVVFKFIINKMIPVLQVILDLFILYINLILDIASIVFEIWNVSTPFIGFIFYFVIDIVLTVFREIITILGSLLPPLFQALMEVITFVVQILVEVLKGILQAGVSVLKILIKVIVPLMKLYFSLIRLIIPIVQFLFVTLFKILRPILFIIVAVCRWFTAFFRGNMAMRQLLSVNYNSKLTIEEMLAKEYIEMEAQPDIDQAKAVDRGANIMVMSMYETATQHYTPKDYDGWMSNLDSIEAELRRLEAAGEIPGFSRRPGDSNSDGSGTSNSARQRERMELHQKDHEHHPLHNAVYKNNYHAMSRSYPANSDSKNNKPQTSEPADPYKEAEKAASAVRGNAARHLLEADMSPAEDFVITIEDIQDDAENETHFEHKATEKQQTNSRPETYRPVTVGTLDAVTEKTKPVNNSPRRQSYEEWRESHLKGKTIDDIFPGLVGGRQLEHKPLTSHLPDELSHEERFEREKLAIALPHALERSIGNAKIRYIDSGHMEWALNSVFTQATGFKSISEAVGIYDERYHSPEHFLFDLMPHLDEWGPMKIFKEMDPEKDTRPFMSDHLRSLGIKDKNEVEIIMDDPVNQRSMIKRGTNGGSQRKLHAIRLEILFERDCYTTTPRNFLCLPNIGSRRLNSTNLREQLLPFEVDPDSACTDLFLPETCSFTNGWWDLAQCFLPTPNRLINAFRVVLFTFTYGLDLWFIITPLGQVFFFARPSILIYTLGKLFPPLAPVVDFVLLLPPKATASLRQYVCWFIHWYDVALLLLYGVIVHFLISPIYELIRRRWQLWATFRALNKAELESRYSFLETYNETRLARKKRQMERSMASVPNISIEEGIDAHLPLLGELLDDVSPHKRDLDPENKSGLRHRGGNARIGETPNQRNTVQTQANVPNLPEVDLSDGTDLKLKTMREFHPFMTDVERVRWCRKHIKELEAIEQQYEREAETLLSAMAGWFGYSRDFLVDHPNRIRLSVEQARRKTLIYEAHRHVGIISHFHTMAYRNAYYEYQKYKDAKPRAPRSVFGSGVIYADPLIHMDKDIDDNAVRERHRRRFMQAAGIDPDTQKYASTMSPQSQPKMQQSQTTVAERRKISPEFMV